MISGVIRDEAGNGIPSASVLIYQGDTESDMITGGSSDVDGLFSVTVAPGSYILKVTFISFESFEIEVETAPGEELDVGVITLSELTRELDEISVEGERSRMEMNFDRRTFHVEQDITSLGGDALDVLDNVPSLATDFDGNITLRGSQGVRILINGRPSSLVRNGTDGLSSIPAHMIKRVEIITNPSARYEAEGSAGIINIVLVDDAEFGFNGIVSARSALPHDHRTSGNFNYHVNSINWFVDTNFRYRNRPRGSHMYEQVSNPDTSYIYRQNRESLNRNRRTRLRVGADIFLPAEQLLTISSRISVQDTDNTSDVYYADYTIDHDFIRNIHREDVSDERDTDYDFRLQYENRFSGSRHRLTADANFGFGWEHEQSSLMQLLQQEDINANEDHDFQSEMTGNEISNQRIQGDEDFYDFRAQVDYERPVGPDGRFETGLRSSVDFMDNSYLVEEQQGEDWVSIPSYHDNFSYREMINAGYGVYSGRRDAFSWQLGLRAEHTDIRTELSISDQSGYQSYFNLFPGLSLTWQVSDGNSVQASYSRRLSRPRSRWTMPFSGFTDSRNIYRGNPDLQPEFVNSYETGYLRHWDSGSIMASVYYRHRTGVIEHISSQEMNPNGDPVTVRSPINLAVENALGLELSADQDLLNNVQLSGSVNYSVSEMEGMYRGEQLESSSDRFQSRVRVRWRFSESWNFYSFIRYRGPRTTTQGRNSAQYFMNSGLAKSFFDRSLMMSIDVRDLFNSRRRDRIIDEPGFYSESTRSWSSRQVRMNVRYRF